MGKKHGKNWRATGKNWEGPSKNLEGMGKDQRSELHYATNLLSIQFGSTYMQQRIYYFMLSVSVQTRFRLKGVFEDSVPGSFL